MAEVIDVTVWAQAADYFGTGLCIDGMALGPDGYFAVIADADAGLLAPDERPPRTSWRGA